MAAPTGQDDENRDISRPSVTRDKDKKCSLSMHEEIPVWYDCCSCEAEPYWEEALARQSSEEKR